MKKYDGNRYGRAVDVTVNGKFLNPRRDLKDFGTEDFDWGLSGLGGSQLSLALLAEHCQDDDLALQLCHDFKTFVVTKLQASHWSLTTEEIEQALREINQAALH